MMIVMKAAATEEEIHVRHRPHREPSARSAHPSRGEEVTVIGAIGDREHVAASSSRAHPGVEQVVPILKPYKLASTPVPPRRARRVIEIDGRKDRRRALLDDRRAVHGRDRATRCSATARVGQGGRRLDAPRRRLQAAHLAVRFQGLGEEGLRLLAEAKAETGLPIVTELMDVRDLEPVLEVADVIQVGARNMQNYTLLAEIGRSGARCCSSAGCRRRSRSC